ncbi:hypothetical protein BH10PSE17_BH10PSE17_14720 [soil metagenome]
MLSACDAVARWDEEVRLSDGTVAVVQRRVVDSGGALASAQLYHPASGAFFKTRGELVPNAFDIRTGVPYVLMTVGSDQLCVRAGYPRYSMIAFAWDSGRWRRVDVDERALSLGFNLAPHWFLNRHDNSKKLSGRVTLSQKDATGNTQEIKSWLAQFTDYCSEARVQRMIGKNLIAEWQGYRSIESMFMER